jgi:nucleoside-diphosphate kinase
MVPLVVFVGLIMQKSLVLLKPDCVERRLVGEIIGRFERKGLNIIAMKMVRVSPELSKQHYAEHVSKPFYPNLEEFITSSPIVAMVIEGLDVVRVIREMLGATNGLKAAPGTIRGDFSSSRQMNLVHASDSEESAVREVSLYFQASELCEYTPTLVGSFRAGDES